MQRSQGKYAQRRKHLYFARRERETVEAERRGELGQPERALDLDGFDAAQAFVHSVQRESDEIVYVLRQPLRGNGKEDGISSSKQAPSGAQNGSQAAEGAGSNSRPMGDLERGSSAQAGPGDRQNGEKCDSSDLTDDSGMTFDIAAPRRRGGAPGRVRNILQSPKREHTLKICIFMCLFMCCHPTEPSACFAVLWLNASPTLEWLVLPVDR
jgi:hypothetical protein